MTPDFSRLTSRLGSVRRLAGLSPKAAARSSERPRPSEGGEGGGRPAPVAQKKGGEPGKRP